MTGTAIDASAEEMSPPVALIPLRDGGIAVARRQSPAALAEQVQEIRELMRAVLVDGTDYGVIPGTNKPTLFKSGAEWLLKWAGFGHKLEPVETERDSEGRKFGITYRATVHLLHDPSCIVATCDGYAGYDEDRFYQSVEALERRERANATRYKRVANAWKWAEEYKAPWNSVLKMCEKRALVGATLQATATSGLFTQDMEDVTPPADTGSGDEAGASRQQRPSTPPKATKQVEPLSKDDAARLAALQQRVAALASAEGARAEFDKNWSHVKRLEGYTIDAVPGELLGLVESILRGVEQQATSKGWDAAVALAAVPDATSPSAPDVTADDTTPAASPQQPADGPEGADAADSGQPTLLTGMDDHAVIGAAGDEHVKVTAALVKAMSLAKVDAQLAELGLEPDGNPDTRRQRLTVAYLRRTLVERGE